MTKKVELCVPCAAAIREKEKQLQIIPGPSKKITCANCGRRRFGQSYSLTKPLPGWKK